MKTTKAKQEQLAAAEAARVSEPRVAATQAASGEDGDDGAVVTGEAIDSIEASVTGEIPDGDILNRLQMENSELKAALRLGDARRAFSAELARSGARSPELLFDAVKGDVQFDDEGKPQNTAALIRQLKTDYPEQFGAGGGIDAGAGHTPGPRLTRAALGRMKPSEIAELDWAEVRRVLAG